MEVCHGSGTSPLDKHWGVHSDHGWDILFSLQCRAGHGALLLASAGRIPPAHMSCVATTTPTWGPPVPPGSHKQDPLLKDPQLLLSSYQTLSNPWCEVAQVIGGPLLHLSFLIHQIFKQNPLTGSSPQGLTALSPQWVYVLETNQWVTSFLWTKNY